MASHFLGLNRGVPGSDYNDYTTGAATTGADIELRVDDGKGFRPVDIKLALKAFERFFENQQQVVGGGFIVNG